ncbi:hypothetical protein OZN62_12205 [Aurantiacibacter sp. MUD11]|uniref:hypothetical protein n=1 Tax=Aurantiacibacter sp. MUD11 TaxID=3003265 RepID=UPI0022AAE274|nr:hypothetical protein [Aurantiacibacter sp. MUD11]WAT17664.1 hypothetical protein OZN62_12205 [Aurantiacibacter sp. MUD11]
MKGNAGRGRRTPIQLRAELLQFIEPEDNGRARPRGPYRRQWSERDLRRAIAIAKRAGLCRFRVEITPEGTISLVVGARPGRR